jgi:hypothetical protein
MSSVPPHRIHSCHNVITDISWLSVAVGYRPLALQSVSERSQGFTNGGFLTWAGGQRTVSGCLYSANQRKLDTLVIIICCDLFEPSLQASITELSLSVEFTQDVRTHWSGYESSNQEHYYTEYLHLILLCTIEYFLEF